MRVGCYSLDLYCDKKLSEDCHSYWGKPDQFVQRETLPRALVDARLAGWKCGRKYDICPSCAKRKEKK